MVTSVPIQQERSISTLVPGPVGAQPAKRENDPGPCLRATPVRMSCFTRSRSLLSERRTSKIGHVSTRSSSHSYLCVYLGNHLARSVLALTAPPFAEPPRSICSIVGCGGAAGLPPIHSVSLHSRCRLVSLRNPRCAACTCFRSYLICCARSHLSRCRRLHPSKCSSDTELPCCLTHLRKCQHSPPPTSGPSRSCRTLATSTRSSLITPASWPVTTLRARW